MNLEKKKFEIYLTVLRFLVYKITANLKQLYLDINLENNIIIITAYYENPPSDLDIELLDDICTNSKAHIPNFIVRFSYKLANEYTPDEKHDFIIFSLYEED